jgi:hypothetical protein
VVTPFYYVDAALLALRPDPKFTLRAPMRSSAFLRTKTYRMNAQKRRQVIFNLTAILTLYRNTFCAQGIFAPTRLGDTSRHFVTSRISILYKACINFFLILYALKAAVGFDFVSSTIPFPVLTST